MVRGTLQIPHFVRDDKWISRDDKEDIADDKQAIDRPRMIADASARLRIAAPPGITALRWNFV